MKRIAIFLSIVLFFGSAHAQKLPNVQLVSLRAPANVKIDGKLTEWGELKAYNKTCEIFYSIANDNENLYLTVQATDEQIIGKIVGGGIAFTINNSGNKKGKTDAVVTFPLYVEGKSNPYLMLGSIKEIKRDAANSSFLLDSLKNSANNKIKSSFKFIGTSGLKDINAEAISVYNTEGISVAAMLDDKLYYNFELAVPLKLIVGNLTPKSFTYNIRLNGPAFGGSDLKLVRDRFLTFTGRDGKNYMMDDASPRSWSLASPSDFWGEYTLAK